ncbi:hypothetical protein B9Z65_8622 [Elsinoe australis]|uniref:Rhodopsin domain-containing protein n=1 Tax=Elsinoe australis TaxID=40998 RepID=A0A2P7YEA7_9PEZI|nr:hypothetical protein B9Z65_8622 [Elsinoe australis]
MERLQENPQQSRNAHFAVFTSVCTILQFLTTIALAARIYVRIKITKNMAKDDWMLIFAHTSNIMANGVWLSNRVKSVKSIPGSIELFQALIARYWVAIGLYVTAGIVTKVAIAFFFLRLARRGRDRVIILLPLMVYIVALSGSMTVILFRCGLPLNAIKVIRDETCAIGPRIVHPLGYMMAVLNTVCDLIFSVVPIHLLRKAHSMSSVSRTSACLVIALANLGTVVSIIKIPFISKATLGAGAFEDSAPVFMLSVIETAVGIMAISMACLRPLLKALRIGSSAPNSTSPDVTPNDQERVTVQVKSSIMSKIKSLQMDSRVLGGIGILPNSTVNSFGLSSIDSERQDSGGVLDESRPQMRRSQTMPKGMASINEIIYKPEDGAPRRESSIV